MKMLIETVNPKESFVLKDDKSLERIANDAKAPKGFIGIQNPLITNLYVEEGNTVKPVEKLKKGQKAYEFQEPFVVYMRI